MKAHARDDSPRTVVVIVSGRLLRAAALSGNGCSKPGTRCQAISRKTQQGQGLVFGMPLGSTFCP